MPYLDVYIIDLEGFDWDFFDQPSKPPRIGPLFPSGSIAFDAVLSRIESGVWDGRKLDWGSWVARLDAEEISSFVAELYQESDEPKELLIELRNVIAGLYPNTAYGLVATEL